MSSCRENKGSRYGNEVRRVPPQLECGLRQLHAWNEADKALQSCSIWREMAKNYKVSINQLLSVGCHLEGSLILG